MYLIVQFIADVLFIVKVESQRLHKLFGWKKWILCLFKLVIVETLPVAE